METRRTMSPQMRKVFDETLAHCVGEWNYRHPYLICRVKKPDLAMRQKYGHIDKWSAMMSNYFGVRVYIAFNDAYYMELRVKHLF
jgi:hypothetical protein